jgi:serine/threonine protein kinase
MSGVDPPTEWDGTATAPAPELADVTASLAAAPGGARYQLEARVGSGGMGIVYKAIDTQLNRAVAIKTVLHRSADSASRLRREARAAASLDHPYICRIYELLDAPGAQLIVMEYVEGETLATVLRRGTPSLTTTLQVGMEIAEGLANAHSHGLVHRDLKPGNVMVTRHGHVKLLDFGLARYDPTELATTESTASVPPHDGPAGTACYMAPEQAEGRPATPAADLFSLGVVLFECVAGRLPFSGRDRHEYLSNVRTSQPLSVRRVAPGTPETLAQLIDACLQRSPWQRPESALRVVAALRGLAESLAMQDAQKARFRRRMAVAAASIVALAGAAYWALTQRPNIPETIWQLRPLVTASSDDSQSRISPDKHWVSYVSTSGIDTRLMVMRSEGGIAQAVTLPPGVVLDHVWSSDGTKLIVAMRQSNSVFIHIIPAFFGGTPVGTFTVATRAGSTRLRLVRAVNRMVFISRTDAGESLLALDFNTRTVTDISGAWKLSGRLTGIDVDPTGRRVAYGVAENGQEDLWIANLDGGRARRLTRDKSFERNPRWRGADSVVFESNRGGQDDLWDISTISGALRPLTSGPDAEDIERASDDGTIVSFTRTSEESHLFSWNPSGGGGTRLTDGALNDYSPSTSVDGSLVLFERSRPTRGEGALSDLTLLLAPFDGRQFASPVRTVADGFAALLSNDGRRVAYLRAGANAGATLYVTELETNATTELSSTSPRPIYSTAPTLSWAEQTFAWTESGSNLYYIDGLTRRSLRRWSPAQGTSDVNAISSGSMRDVRTSADGRTLAYVTVAAGPRSALHILDLARGADRVVAHFDGAVYIRGWLRRGQNVILVRSLAYHDDFSADLEIMSVGLDGRIQVIGRVDNAFVATTGFNPTTSSLCATRSERGVHNVFCVGVGSGETSQVTDNTTAGISFSAIQPGPGGVMVGAMTSRRRHVWLLETAAGTIPGAGASHQ